MNSTISFNSDPDSAATSNTPLVKKNVSNSARTDLLNTDLDNNNSHRSDLGQSDSSDNKPMPVSISEENLSQKSKKSNSDESSGSKASPASKTQNKKPQSENSQTNNGSFFGTVSEPPSTSESSHSHRSNQNESSSQNLNDHSSNSSGRNRRSNSRSQSSDSKSVASPENKSYNNNDESNSEHRSVTDSDVRRLSSNKDVSSGARDIDKSHSSSTTVSGDLGAFFDGVSFSESAIPVAKTPPRFTASDEESSSNTNSDVGDVAKAIGLDITPKKQSTSNAHRSSSSSSKKSSSDSNEDNDSSENINNNRRLTWDELSGLRSFQNLQGVYSLQQCFANAFGYTNDLNGTKMTPDSDFVSKKFSRHLAAHCVDLANNGNISKMFEHLRKQERDTYQAVSDKWDATRALVQGLDSAPAKPILKLLWKLDGTGTHEKDLIAKLTKLNDQGAELISLIPENTTFSTLLKMYSGTKNRTIVVSDDDYVPSASYTDYSEWTSKSSSRSNSNSDNEQNSPSSKNSKKKINRDDDDPSGKSSNHGLTQQQLLTDENFTNLPDENLKKAFANAFGFQYGDQSDVPGDEDILDQFRTLFANNYTKYVTSGTYDRIIALFELLQRQAGDTYSEIQDKLIAIYNLLRANKFTDSRFIADFWRWNISDPNDDLLVKHFWHSDRGWEVLPKAHMDYMIDTLHDCLLRRRLTEIISQNLEGVSWDDLLRDDDLNSLPEDLKKLFYKAHGFKLNGESLPFTAWDPANLIELFRKTLSSHRDFFNNRQLWEHLSDPLAALKDKNETYYSELCDKLSSVEFLSGEFGNNLDEDFISVFWMWDPDDSENNSLVEYYRDDPETGKPLPGKMYIDFLISEHSDLEIVQSLQNMVDSLQPRPAEEEEEEAPDPTSWEALLANQDLQNLPDKLKRILLNAFGFDNEGHSLKPDHPSIIQRLRTAFAKDYVEYTADNYYDNLAAIFTIFMNKSDKYHPYAEIWNKVYATDSLRNKFGELDQDFMVDFWEWKPYEKDTSLDKYYFKADGTDSPGKQYIDFLVFGDKGDDYVEDAVYGLEPYLKKIIDKANEGQEQQPNSEEEEEEEALTEVTWEYLSKYENWKKLPKRLKAIFRRAFGFSESGQPKDYDSNEILKRFRSAFADNYMSYNENYSESVDSLLVLLLSETGDTYNEINDKSCLTDELIKKFRNPDKDFMTAFWTWNVLDPNDDGKISQYYHEEDTPGKACLDFVLETLRGSNANLKYQLNRAIGIGNAEGENSTDEDADN